MVVGSWFLVVDGTLPYEVKPEQQKVKSIAEPKIS
jgi:hypothetical protein